MTAIPKRRWFAFSLRTLLVAVTLTAVGLWLVRSNLIQIREREQIMHSNRVRYDWGHRNRFQTRLPIVWALLGARCYDWIDFPVQKFTPGDLAELQHLFPEAELSLYDPNHTELDVPAPNGRAPAR